MLRTIMFIAGLTLLVSCQKDTLNLANLNGTIAYVDQWNIHTIDIRGDNYKQITHDGEVSNWNWGCFCYLYSVSYDFPTWSPDGSKLLFSDIPILYVYQGGTISEIPINNVDYINWSSDGNKLVISRTEYLPSETNRYLHIIEYGSWNVIDRFEGSFNYPSWSPTENKIAFFSDGLKLLDINSREVLHLADSVYSSLFYPGSNINNPIEWSPYGNKIAYVKADNSVSIIEISDRSQKMIFAGSKDEVDILGWSKDNEYIIVKDVAEYVTVINTANGQTSRITEDLRFYDGDAYLY